MTLIEVLLVAVLGASLLVTVNRFGRALQARLHTASAASLSAGVATEATEVSTALVRSAVVVRTLGDSALLFGHRVLVAVPCRDGSFIPIDPWASEPVRSGDRLWLLRLAQDGGPPRWEPSDVVIRLAAGPTCAERHPDWLVLMAVRESWLGRYRTASGDWTLGLRDCVEGRCGAPQPIASPLSTPSLGGWRVEALPCAVALYARGLHGGPPQHVFEPTC